VLTIAKSTIILVYRKNSLSKFEVLSDLLFPEIYLMIFCRSFFKIANGEGIEWNGKFKFFVFPNFLTIKTCFQKCANI
jgi:hypothetical protein